MSVRNATSVEIAHVLGFIMGNDDIPCQL